MTHTTIIGRLTRDPEYGNGSNTTYLKFDVAVNRPENDEVDYWHCILWSRLADSMRQYLRKGRLVSVAGRNLSSKFVKDGVTRKDWTLHGKEIELLDRPSSDNSDSPELATANNGPWS